MALGVMGELRRLGIDVPGQVAVAGFGGVPDAADASPPLTTIALPLEKMAADAVEWVLPRERDEAEAGEAKSGTAEAGGEAEASEVEADGVAGAGGLAEAGGVAEAGAAGSVSAPASTAADVDIPAADSESDGTDERAEITVRGDVVLRESTELSATG